MQKVYQQNPNDHKGTIVIVYHTRDDATKAIMPQVHHTKRRRLGADDSSADIAALYECHSILNQPVRIKRGGRIYLHVGTLPLCVG